MEQNERDQRFYAKLVSLSILLIVMLGVLHFGLKAAMKSVETLPVPEITETIVKEKIVKVPGKCPPCNPTPASDMDSLVRVRQSDGEVVCEIQNQMGWMVMKPEVCLQMAQGLLESNGRKK